MHFQIQIVFKYPRIEQVKGYASHIQHIAVGFLIRRIGQEHAYVRVRARRTDGRTNQKWMKASFRPSTRRHQWQTIIQMK
jgi:hypothetical protein